MLTGKRLIEDAIPIDVDQPDQREREGRRADRPPRVSCTCGGPGALSPRPGPRSTPRWCQRTDTTATPPSWRTSSTRSAAGAARSRRFARRERRCSPRTGASHRKCVDLFAGGGAIPLEAARLGCEVTAIELNPVAHLIERMMLEYPQAYPGLADDVRRWGKVWVDRAWDKLADLYPPVRAHGASAETTMTCSAVQDGRRTPLAYLWTRTVRCPNPALAEHRVDLVRQTWLGKKKGRMVALKPIVDREALTVTYEVVEAPNAAALGFDPAAGSTRGQATCRICGATVTADYVKREGRAGRMGVGAARGGRAQASRAAVATTCRSGRYRTPRRRGLSGATRRAAGRCPRRAAACWATPRASAPPVRAHPFPRPFHRRDNLLALCTLAAGVREVYEQMRAEGVEEGRAAAVATALAMVIDKVADHCSALCRWIAAPVVRRSSQYLRAAGAADGVGLCRSQPVRRLVG